MLPALVGAGEDVSCGAWNERLLLLFRRKLLRSSAIGAGEVGDGFQQTVLRLPPRGRSHGPILKSVMLLRRTTHQINLVASNSPGRSCEAAPCAGLGAQVGQTQRVGRENDLTDHNPARCQRISGQKGNCRGNSRQVILPRDYVNRTHIYGGCSRQLVQLVVGTPNFNSAAVAVVPP